MVVIKRKKGSVETSKKNSAVDELKKVEMGLRAEIAKWLKNKESSRTAVMVVLEDLFKPYKERKEKTNGI